ncbi:histone-like nucleoid-structuring protein, MvaT/MvaU family [Modicisalibacter xianhensis]|uniref:H-NS histone family protein n=1 Tax=Modicisalibacter xianhensis TaxID=442341 RepID=A0A1I3FTP9_9GAMM|nr:histone-like nucleoid-structuring protein, MvaT/MvaU family [Halomonas xianhensis]SFI14527.1 H-NS histone family protein [Halomonas xianhensis]
MSSTLQKYVEKERLLKQLSEELKQLEGDQNFQRELEFKNKLEALMNEFDKSAADVIELLQPGKPAEAKVSQPSSGGGRRKRRLKIYKNPNTGEVVETRGGNQKTLKAWKEEHGDETVESWLVRIEE